MQASRRRYLWTTGRGTLVLCLAWAAVVALAVHTGLRLLVNQELASFDLRLRWRGPHPPPPEIVILAIDQRSLAADMFTTEELAANPELALLQAYPLPRRVYASALDRLMAAGAKAVAIDLLFLSPTEDDALLQAAVTRHRKQIVLASNFVDNERFMAWREAQLMLPSPVVPADIPTKTIAGFVNYWPDIDGCTRRARHHAQETGAAPGPDSPVLASSFAWLAAQQLAPDRMGPVEGYIDFAGPSGTFPSRPFYELFYPRAWEQNLQGGEFFRNKLVLIGPSQNFGQDQHPTPFGMVDGVEIHASAIATLLHGTGPHNAPGWLVWLAILGMALVTALLLNTPAHPLMKLLFLLAAGGGYAAAAVMLFLRAEIVIPMVAPLWTVVGGGAAGLAMQVAAERLEKLRVRRTLEKYVSRPVAAEILRHSDEYESSLGGKRRSVTILYSDIRDFTPLAERSDPFELVRQLNEYLTAMVEIVMRYEGTLDKFVGDALMAVYGSPLSAGPVEDAWRAVQTAAAMRTRLAELQAQWAAQGRPVLRIGIGLNHGDVVVGNIGSPQRMEYTVIGDAVNICARVEGLCKTYQTDIVLTESVYELVKDRVTVQPLDTVSVKGREQQLTIYALAACRT